jgi:hypothetical protein
MFELNFQSPIWLCHCYLCYHFSKEKLHRFINILLLYNHVFGKARMLCEKLFVVWSDVWTDWLHGHYYCHSFSTSIFSFRRFLNGFLKFKWTLHLFFQFFNGDGVGLNLNGIRFFRIELIQHRIEKQYFFVCSKDLD